MNQEGMLVEQTITTPEVVPVTTASKKESKLSVDQRMAGYKKELASIEEARKQVLAMTGETYGLTPEEIPKHIRERANTSTDHIEAQLKILEAEKVKQKAHKMGVLKSIFSIFKPW